MLRPTLVGTQALIFFLLNLVLPIGILPVLSYPTTVKPIPQDWSASELVEQGRALYTKGQFSQAASTWEQAAQAYESQGDRLHQAMILSYLSLAYQKLQQWFDAEDAIAFSLNLLETGSDLRDTPDYQQIQAQALNTLGSLELALGQPDTALEAWQLATEIYQQIKDDIGITGTLINQAQAMEALGLHRRTCKTLLQALKLDNNCDLSNQERFETVLQTFQQTPDPQIKILGLRSLGNSLRLLGDLNHSQQVLQASLKVAQPPLQKRETLLSLGHTERSWYNHYKQLYTRTNLIVKQKEVKEQVIEQFNHARKYYQESLQESSKLSESTSLDIEPKLHRLSLLIDYHNWLETFNVENNKDNQRSNIQELKSQINDQVKELLNSEITELPPSRTAIYAQINFVESLISYELKSNKDEDNLQGSSLNLEPYEIAHSLVKAVQEAQVLDDKRAESYALGTLGKLYEQTQQWYQAQEFTEKALTIAQGIQSDDIAYQWQWQLGRIYKALGKTEEAITAYQATVKTLDSLRQDLLALSSDVQFSFRENVEQVYRELVDLLLKDEQSAEPIANKRISDNRIADNPISDNKLKQATEAIDSLQLAQIENFLGCNLSDIVELAEQEIDPSAALVYPIILDDRLAVIVKLPKSGEFIHYTTALPKAKLEQTLESLRIQLEKRFISKNSLALSQQVYDWLIRPAEGLLEANQVKTLVFVLDGGFRNVPMATLHDGEQYIVEKGYAIALIPGLSLLEPKPLAQVELNALAFGLSEIREDLPDHQGFANLPNVKTELGEIKSQIPSQQLLNQDFTSQKWQELISSVPFPVVHLATHGQFSSVPEETFLLAWDKRINIKDLSNVIQNRSNNSLEAIELLVLSACKTADGDSRASLGLAGVAIQSGARSTLASLWFINDESTAKLMTFFYEELAASGATVTKAEALRRAQVNLLKRPGYQAPFYWGAYVLVGNWL
ncbi:MULTISPECIES: CHAT domain-containing protein [unclassified Moorena]|uniref:CHAT domain-containing protein n=1 Tax=unclassified Moorena TaxID=2683338 RepID=UPI0013C959FB|nr:MULTISPECIES: CHAT domain-containing protein [unclassified Moorena]NEO19006.1 CHAT domain-containing protein [Moorena sp. SIO4A5]NEQ60966.1 CHAT domain-containing protein [Moorena sp. SIO4A1]